tara:strand:+ start:542 stop:1156 length:615 start_codon:yes stop_codon:yes gene_type:complete
LSTDGPAVEEEDVDKFLEHVRRMERTEAEEEGKSDEEDLEEEEEYDDSEGDGVTSSDESEDDDSDIVIEGATLHEIKEEQIITPEGEKKGVTMKMKQKEEAEKGEWDSLVKNIGDILEEEKRREPKVIVLGNSMERDILGKDINPKSDLKAENHVPKHSKDHPSTPVRSTASKTGSPDDVLSMYFLILFLFWSYGEPSFFDCTK